MSSSTCNLGILAPIAHAWLTKVRCRVLLPAVLLMVSLSPAWAVDYEAYARRLSSAKPIAAQKAILRELLKEVPEGSQLADQVAAAVSGDQQRAESLQSVISMVKSRAFLDSGKPPALKGDPNAQAREIAASPGYRDPGAGEESNWIQRALEKLYSRQLASPKTPDAPAMNLPSGGLDLIVIAVWTMLGLGVAIFLYFAIRSFAWKKSLKRQASAMLDEDEPMRTADEWLERADGLAGDQRYREAVRCLYLACLLRIDEYGVARFDRGQTNWEHLSRIEASPKKPQGLSFSGPTGRFDQVWYGRKVRGAVDVDEFRAFYTGLMGLLQGAAA